MSSQKIIIIKVARAYVIPRSKARGCPTHLPGDHGQQHYSDGVVCQYCNRKTQPRLVLEPTEPLRRWAPTDDGDLFYIDHHRHERASHRRRRRESGSSGQPEPGWAPAIFNRARALLPPFRLDSGSSRAAPGPAPLVSANPVVIGSARISPSKKLSIAAARSGNPSLGSARL